MIDVALALNFGQQGNEEHHLGFGWSAGEAGFRWMIGEASDLWLEHPEPGGDYILELTLDPFVRPPAVPQQRLTVSVRGVMVGQTALKAGGVWGYRIPADILARPGPVRLTFRHQDARRPCDVDAAADDRLLAVSVRQARLLRIRPAERPLSDAAGASVGGLAVQTTGVSTPLPLAPDAHRPDMPMAELVTKFASLGDNCEFGLVQRRCGVEPLGLLRFANIELPSLLRGIRSGFDALGDVGNTRLQDDADDKEYVIRETGYGITYHTFRYKDQVAADMLLAQQATRLKFLSRMLMDNIRGAEKIFVVKRNVPFSEQEILPLYVALNEYADNVLLWVLPADESHPPGRVERVMPGLLKAYIDRFAPPENAHDLSFELWLDICAKAYALAAIPFDARR